jgi:alpha/beta superfamily hydrolase
LSRFLDKSLLTLVRKLRRPTRPFSTQDIHFQSSVGYRISATLLTPQTHGPVPAVVMCPGSTHDRSVFFNNSAPIQARELAEMGIAVLCHDPSGRGHSWGPEDWGGLEHQDNVAQAVRWLRTMAPATIQQVGVLSISLGLSSAVGGAKQLAQTDTPVQWLIDWEGPIDRPAIMTNLSRNGQKLARRIHDTVFWESREANKHVMDIKAGYWRFQTSANMPRTLQESEAVTMTKAAAQGRLPWFQLNRHEKGEIPAQFKPLATGVLDANRALRYAVSVAIRRS